MIIYRKSDTELVIPCGLGTVVCPDTDHSLQMKTVDSSTVLQDITPDASYYGLYRVIVNPYELDSKTVDSSTELQVITSSKDGLFEVIVNPYTLESKTQTITVNGEYSFTPDEANGLSRVDISVNVADIPAVLQSKTADASTETQVITPDEGYDGLSQVTVDPYTLESKSDTITENGVYAYYPSTADGFADVTIDVSIDTVNNQTKTVDSSTTIQYVQPDNGYTGLEYVAVNPYTLDSKTVNPSTGSQTVTSDEDGLSSVTVNPVTAAIDPDLVPGNIKKDIDILGVVGTFEGGALQSKTVDSSTSSQTITPDGVNYGLSSVTVNPYTEETISETITQNGQYTYTAQNADTLSEVTIDVSVADIPAVIQTKSVTYTQNGEYTVTKDAGYDGMSSVDISVNVPTSEPELQSKTVDSSTSSQTITPDQNYDGLSSVTVNPYALENKTLDSSTSQQTISADNGYDGLNMVTVNPYTLDSKTVDSSTVSQIVTSSQDGLSSVTVNPYVLDSKTVDASIASVTVTSSEDGLSSVTVNAVTAEIDPNIKSYNIVEGVTILGVTGSMHIANLQLVKGVDSSTTVVDVYPDQGYDGMRYVYVRPYHLSTDSSVLTQNGQYVFEPSAGYNGLSQVTVDVSVDGQPINNQNKTVDSSTVSQSITADQGYTGLGSVTVNPYTLDSSTVDPSTSQIVVTSNADGLSSVTVNAVNSTWPTETITENGLYSISAQDLGSNFLEGIDIDVSVDGQQINNQNKTVDSSTVSQSITADQGYTGLGTVTVNPYTTETDSSVLTQNGTYTFTPQNADAISSVTVDVNVSGIQDGSITLNVVQSSASSLSPALGSVENPPKNAIVNIWRGNTGMSEDDRAMNSELALLNSVSLENVTITTPYKYTVTYVVLMLGSYHLAQNPYHNPFIKECPNVKNITIDLSDRITSMKVERAIFFDPDDTSTYSQLSDLTLTVPWFALDSSNNGKICENLGDKLTNLILTRGPITSSITTDNYGMSLTSNSVYNILSQLDANTSGESVTFYSGGLTITDYPDGSIQAAYDAAVAAGWTINNLTINQPAPTITLLEYITAGDSHTENNKIQLPCNVTNETVIQFTVNWRDDQGGAFIATAARDFEQNEWRTFGYNNCLYSDLGGGTGGDRFYEADTWSAVYQQYGTVEIGVDSSYHIYQKDVSTGITYTSTSPTSFRSIGNDRISYIGSDYTWLREIKVYENGISGGLTYDFVAAKDQNDVPGLYDTVGGVMYYATTGSMIAGPVLS